MEMVQGQMKNYYWIKDKLSGDPEASQMLAQQVMRFSKKIDLSKCNNDANFAIHMGRLLAASAYTEMAISLVDGGMPIEEMSIASTLEAVSLADWDIPAA